MKVDIAPRWLSFGKMASELPSEEVDFTTFVRHTAVADSNFPEMAMKFPGAKFLQGDIPRSWEWSDAPRNAKLFPRNRLGGPRNARIVRWDQMF